MALLRLAEWVLLSKTTQGCNACSDKTPPRADEFEFGSGSSPESLEYRLVDRAAAMGWSDDRIEVIDDDLGKSGRSVEYRVGFQRMIAEVSMGHVGIIFSIEMSRLARSCRDWHQLLEICSLFETLLADADGVYDPRNHNDRLLLGLKGTMSEAELHVLQGRLRAGQLNKARRGEYFTHAPIG